MGTSFSVVDLFAGIGGFSQGFLRVNRGVAPFRFDLRLLVDCDPTANATFKRNYPSIPYWTADVGKLSSTDILGQLKMKTGELDFVIGGPPCQGFSPNGKRWLEDNRNRLLSRFIEIAHELRPKCVILENVPTALSSFEKIFDSEVQEAFDGYCVKSAVLNASAFGVPQIRRRAFVVALRNDLGLADFSFPQGEFDTIDIGNDAHTDAKAEHRFISVEDAIGDLPTLEAGAKSDGDQYPHAARTAYQSDRRKGSLALFMDSRRLRRGM